ncbi:MAG: hypothetical protein WC683_02690 [bacterium]
MSRPRSRTTRDKDNSDKPWVSNYPELQRWLDDHDARCQWQLPMGDPESPSAYVEAWQFSTGHVAIITVRGNRNGWNIYSALPSNLTIESLDDAAKRLGLTT